MMIQTIVLAAFLCLGQLQASEAPSATKPGNLHTSARLLSEVETAPPGGSFWVGLELTMDKGWHTYWKYPGVFGLPSAIEWSNLPDGVQVGSFEWPVPLIYGGLDATSYVFEGTVLLMFKVTLPADFRGPEIILEGTAKWLECDPEQCVPGSQPVFLRLPVSAGTPRLSSSARAFSEARTQLPVALEAEAGDAWQVKARREGDLYVVHLKPLRSVDLDPSKIEFFSENGQTVEALNRIDKLSPEDQLRVEQENRRLRVTKQADGSLELRIAASDVFEGDTGRLPAVLKYAGGWPTLGRTGLRIEPEMTTVAATAQTPASAGAAPLGLPLLLLYGWLGGLILNLMPCVFPVIGLKIMSFVKQAGEDPSQVVRYGWAFSAGVMASFWVLALAIILLNKGWGFQMQQPEVVLGLMLFFLIFGLNLSGVFELGTSIMGVGSELGTRKGLEGAFFSGVLATVVSTPCSGPFLAVALGGTLLLPPIQAFAVFTSIGLGLCTPYLLLSAYPAAVKKLPRPGAWMETFRQALAFPIYGTVGYMAWVYAGQVEAEQSFKAMLGLPVAALSAWIWGRFTLPHLPRTVRMTGASVASGVLLSLIAVLYSGNGKPEIVWEAWSAERVEALRAQKRPVYIDFTARWCATCQANKYVYKDRKVIDAYTKAGVVFLKADNTHFDPAIEAAIRQYGFNAIPLNVLYLPGAEKAHVFDSILTPDALLEPFSTR